MKSKPVPVVITVVKNNIEERDAAVEAEAVAVGLVGAVGTTGVCGFKRNYAP